MKTYKKVIDWLFQQFPAYQNIGAGAYKPDLETISKLLSALNNPHHHQKYIHIAGTNGKGSTSHIIASILQAHGYKVGLFTSPHLVDFRERIKVNGNYISEDDVVHWVNETLPQLALNYSPSFFELTFAMAIDYFAKQNCDVSIIETGLGGRLDATNVIQPVVSVITNIGLDHQQFLGNTRTEIAKEKAGIIKDNTPIVICEKDNETERVFVEVASNKNAPITWVDSSIQLTTDLLGDFQQLNANTAKQAVELFAELENTKLDITKTNLGLATVKNSTNFKGRMDVIAESPLTILDGAHNTEGIKALLNTIKKINKGHLKIVYGASSDKNIDEISLLFPEKAELFLTSFNHARSFTMEDLEKKTANLPHPKTFYNSPIKALKSAQNSANKEDTILIFGSLFLLADFF